MPACDWNGTKMAMVGAIPTPKLRWKPKKVRNLRVKMGFQRIWRPWFWTTRFWVLVRLHMRMHEQKRI